MDEKPGRFAAQGGAPFADKESVGLRLHFLPLDKPGLDGPDFIRAQGVGRGQALFQPSNMEDAALDVHLGQLKAAGLRHAQPMAEHHEQKAPVAGFISGPPGGGKKPINFEAGEVFSIVHHFV